MFNNCSISQAILPEEAVPDILLWWKNSRGVYPTLSRMAQDFLTIPASGVGVENLFSTARDICHYRRSRLSPETIEAIMLQMCTDRFMIAYEFQQLSDASDIEPIASESSSRDAQDMKGIEQEMEHYISDDEIITDYTEEDYEESIKDSDINLHNSDFADAQLEEDLPLNISTYSRIPQDRVEVALPVFQQHVPDQSGSQRSLRRLRPAKHHFKRVQDGK